MPVKASDLPGKHPFKAKLEVALKRKHHRKDVDLYMAEKALEELNAHEVKVFLNKDGLVVSSQDLIAWDIRQKARQDIHKILGDYAPTKTDITSGGEKIPLTYFPPEPKTVEEWELMVADMKRKKAEEAEA